MKVIAAFIMLGLTQVYRATAGISSCSNPPPINNGDYSFVETPECSRTLGFDSSCAVRVICNPGYSVNGPTFVYCEYTGLWYEWSMVPTCEATHYCPEPPSLENGEVRQENYGEYVRYICNEGFELEGNLTRHCQDSGKWSGQQPTCKGKPLCKDGRKPGRVQNGNVVVSAGELAQNKRYRVGTVLEYTCEPAHKLIGKSARACKPSGKWDATKPRCNAVTCLPLQDVAITNGWTDAQNRTYYKGDVINFYCNYGYRTIGKKWRVCCEKSSGETVWSDETPTCQEIRCPRINRIEHGTALPSSQPSIVGTTVTFQCHSGYILNGPEEVECRPNGKWTGSSVCNALGSTGCGNPGSPPNGFKTGTSYNWNDEVQFTCNAGYTLIGSQTRLCNRTLGGWSGEQPTCQDANEFDDIDDVIRNVLAKTSSIANETADTDNVNATSVRGRIIDVNYDGGWNIYFVFDASYSVGRQNFQKGIDFAKALVSKVGVGKALYGALVFASKPTVVFHLSDPYRSVPDVHMALKEAERELDRGFIGSGTGTREALTLLEDEMIANTPNRPAAKSAIFLITDGKSNEGGNPVEEAKQLKTDHSMAFHCIGVGAEVDKEELANLASKPLANEHLFFLKDYDDVEALAYAVTRQQEDYSQCGKGLGPTGGNNVRGRIVGGTNAPVGAWPWITGLYEQEHEDQTPTFFCGGSLISPDWILTAAHCFDGQSWKPQDLRVVLGTIQRDIDEPDENRRILRVAEGGIIKHTMFNSENYDYDIALLRLDTSAELSRRIRTICLPDPEENNDDLLKLGEGQQSFPFPYVTGWGHIEARTEFDIEHNIPADTPEVLQQLALPLKGRKTCLKSLESIDDVGPEDFTERMICAGYKKGDLTEEGEKITRTGERDSCSGDSGGPLVRKRTSEEQDIWYQIGIVSWGVGCAQPGQYGYYTHLPKLVNWVNSQMQNYTAEVNN